MPKLVGKIRAALIVSLVLFSTSGHLYAENGPTGPNFGLLAAAQTPTGATTGAEQLPTTSSLERVAEIQQLVVDFAKNPVWIMTTAGISLGFFVANQSLVYLLDDVPKIYQAVKELKKMSAANEQSKGVFEALAKRIFEYGKTAQDVWKATQDLELSRRTLMLSNDLENEKIDAGYRKAMQYARDNFSHLTAIEQMNAFSTNKALRRRLNGTDAGKTWLARWDARQKKFDELTEKLSTNFGEIRSTILQFSGNVNAASHGWIRVEELRHRPLQLGLDKPVSGPIGSFYHMHDSGMQARVEDPRDLPRALGTSLTACREQFTRLSFQRDRAWKQITYRGAVKPALLTGGGVLAWSLFTRGSKEIKKQFNADPTEIVQSRKKSDAAEALRLAYESTSPTKMAESIHTWRSNKDNAIPEKLFLAIHDTMHTNVARMAEDIRRKADGKLDLDELQSGLNELQKDPQKLKSIMELALADAAVNELKLTDPSQLEAILLAESTDTTKSVQREQLLTFTFGVAPKYIWPLLITDRSSYPVDFSTTSSMLNAAKEGLDKVRVDAVAAKKAATTKETQTSTTPPAPSDKSRAEVLKTDDTLKTTSSDKPSPPPNLQKPVSTSATQQAPDTSFAVNN